MSEKPEPKNVSDKPEIDESRRNFITVFGRNKQGEIEAQPQEDGDVIEDAANFSALNPEMGRRDFNALPLRVAIATVVAELAFLIPDKAEAQNAPSLGPANKIWNDLDPSQINTPDLDLLDNRSLPRPPLYFQHNVRNKIEKKGVNIPTPSMVFELAKLCRRICKDEITNIGYRKKILAHMKEVAAKGHRDHDRIMEMHANMTAVDAENMKDWLPLVKQSNAVMKSVQKLVTREESAAKKHKTASPAQNIIPRVKDHVPLKLKVDHGTEFDQWEEVLPDTRPCPLFSFHCGILPRYEEKERPQTSSLPTEAAFMFRNIARVYHEVAVQRHKAYENIRAWADLLPKSPANAKLKAKLYKIAASPTNKPIRDGWGSLLDEKKNPKTGKRGEIIELVKAMVIASNKKMNRAFELERCAPHTMPNEDDYLDVAIEDLEKMLRGEKIK
jgi:hypothetical protein